jgi:hypothetical protein
LSVIGIMLATKLKQKTSVTGENVLCTTTFV